MGTSRNAALDGVRGIAVVLVLLYHHGLLNSGWLGVDLFFVLSGFLITTILRLGRAKANYWSLFWIKRLLRIVPPLTLVLVLTTVLSFPLSRQQAAAYLFSLGDVLAYLRPTFEPLRPLWSLAVEEHFYLLWPFAVRYWNRRFLVATLVGLVALEPVLRAVVTIYQHQWQLVYFLTPFRLDGLSLGALLAILVEEESASKNIRAWCAPVGISLALAWFALRWRLGEGFTRNNPTGTYNALCYSLVAAVSACLIAHLLTHPKSLVARMLSTRGLAWIGLISYGLYLYQAPVHEAVNRHYPRLNHASLFLDGPITFALATLSYYLIEKPAMRLGRRQPAFRRREEADPVSSPVL